jgi:hypothetical protein
VGRFQEESRAGSPFLAPKERTTFMPNRFKMTIASDSRIFPSSFFHKRFFGEEYPRRQITFAKNPTPPHQIWVGLKNPFHF